MPENNQMMSVEGQIVGMPLAGPESFSQQQLTYLKKALGMDETVLFSDSEGVRFNNVTCNLSESWFNFERVKVYTKFFTPNSGQTSVTEFIPTNVSPYQCAIVGGFVDDYSWTTSSPVYDSHLTLHSNSTGTVLTLDKQWNKGQPDSNWTNNNQGRLYKVIGIHRIAGGNT